MVQEISENGLRLIEQFEGGQSSDGLFHAYWDRFGGVWTIGYGETEQVHSGMTWTKAQAENDLRLRLDREYEPAIRGLGVPLNQNQYDALCSFVWNLGAGSMQWDVGRYLRARNYASAGRAMLQYDRAGGSVLAGLVRRRQTEYHLFMTAVKPPDPHHYERYSDGPITFAHGAGEWHKKLVLHERATVQEYDNRMAARPKKGSQSDIRIRSVLRPQIQILRDRIWVIANKVDPEPNGNPSWGVGWRGWKWQKFNDRLTGPVKIP